MAHTSAFAKGRFVCFDGEGITIDGRHEYCLLASFDGAISESVANWSSGLRTEQCFRFLLDHAQFEGIHVIYGGSYDANMMFRTLSRKCLEDLQTKGRTYWRGYWIDYRPRKYFGIQHPRTGKSIRIWDVIGFFQGSFVKTLSLWLDVKDDVINKGKGKRSSFTASEAEEITYYCHQELFRFYDLMRRFWESIASLGLTLSRWDGAGAGASALYKLHGMRDAIGTYNLQKEYYPQAQVAYAGGTFQLFMPGDYESTVYEYDINSAYPHFIRQLPPFRPLYTRVRNGRFGCGCKAEIQTYDLVHYRYKGNIETRWHPMFHRDSVGRITKPNECEGWAWAPEIFAGMASVQSRGGSLEILDIYHWHDEGDRPFQWIDTEYQKRLALQAMGDRAQHALKLFLNSLYGKLAQQKGWKPTRPDRSIPWTHNLYMAGWVTASTRAMLQRLLVSNGASIIACETDAVFSTSPLDVSTGIELGQWKETVFPKGLSYLQSGIYFGEKQGGGEIERYRGVDQYDRNGNKLLTRAKVLRAWERMNRGGPTALQVSCTRFRTMGTSLVGERLETWRQWTTEDKALSLIPGGKRVHVPPLCGPEHQSCKPACQWGKGRSHITWPTSPYRGDVVSKPYAVLWVTGAAKQPYLESEEIDNEESIYDE